MTRVARSLQTSGWAEALPKLRLIYSSFWGKRRSLMSCLPSHAKPHLWSTATLFHPIFNVNKKVIVVTMKRSIQASAVKMRLLTQVGFPSSANSSGLVNTHRLLDEALPGAHPYLFKPRQARKTTRLQLADIIS